jgi:HSP20 family protein
MVIQRWDPFREMRQVENAMNRLWGRYGGLNDWRSEIEQWSIPIDVLQKGDEVLVKASLPGVKPEEIDVSVEDNVLSIKAESSTEKETEDKGYLVRERSYGSFYRALRLPENVDPEKIKSSYKDGVLEINMPKAEEKKRKQIKVDVSSGTKQIK